MACNGSELKIVHYNCAISACEKDRQWEKALALLEEVKAREGIELDAYTYNTAISACEKGRQWERALTLLEEVKQREDIELDAYTYNAAISACEKCGQWEKALALLEEAKGREGVHPNTYTYSAAISACEKCGQWEKALALLEEMKEREGVRPNCIHTTYNAVLDAVSDQPVIARQLYLEAVESNIYQPSSRCTDSTGTLCQLPHLSTDITGSTGSTGSLCHLPHLWMLDLHQHSEGAASTAARWWIETQVLPWHFGEDASPAVSLELITGYGRSRQSWKKGELSGGDVKAAVAELLVDMEVPIDETDTNPGRLVIDRSRWHRRAACSTE
jgi:pentatricopeptide repeat protein